MSFDIRTTQLYRSAPKLIKMYFSLISQRPLNVTAQPQTQPQTHLSFGEVQLLSNLFPLYRTQVSVLAEGGLQFADLLGGELGPHPSLLGGLPLAVFSHLVLGPRSVTAAIWKGRAQRFNSLSPIQYLHRVRLCSRQRSSVNLLFGEVGEHWRPGAFANSPNSLWTLELRVISS